MISKDALFGWFDSKAKPDKDGHIEYGGSTTSGRKTDYDKFKPIHGYTHNKETAHVIGQSGETKYMHAICAIEDGAANPDRNHAYAALTFLPKYQRPTAEITALYTHPSHRRKGYASSLIGYIKENHPNSTLLVEADPFKDASVKKEDIHAMYKQHGFVDVPNADGMLVYIPNREKKADAVDVIAQGWHKIEDEFPSKQNRPKEPGALLLAKVKETLQPEEEVKKLAHEMIHYSDKTYDELVPAKYTELADITRRMNMMWRGDPDKYAEGRRKHEDVYRERLKARGIDHDKDTSFVHGVLKGYSHFKWNNDKETRVKLTPEIINRSLFGLAGALRAPGESYWAKKKDMMHAGPEGLAAAIKMWKDRSKEINESAGTDGKPRIEVITGHLKAGGSVDNVLTKEDEPHYVNVNILRDGKQLSHYHKKDKYWGPLYGSLGIGTPVHKTVAKLLEDQAGLKGKARELIWRGRQQNTHYFNAVFDKLKQIGTPKMKSKWEDITPDYKWMTGELQKKAIELKFQQHPTADQVARQPSAVIVQGDQQYIKGNHRAKKFYEDIAEYIRHKGYSVQIVKEKLDGEPPKANVVVSHGGVTPSKGTKVLNIPQYPTPFLTKSILGALDKLVAKK